MRERQAMTERSQSRVWQWALARDPSTPAITRGARNLDCPCFFLHWGIIASQYCASFSAVCVHTSPPTSPPRPTPLGFHRALSGAPCDIQKLSTGCLFYSSLLWQCIYVNTNLPVRPTLLSPAHRVYMSVLHVCVAILALQILLSIKRNEIGSFEVMWMNNLESVTQSEVSQKERNKYCISSVQSLSCIRLFGTPWTVACQASLSITNSWSLPKLMSVE